MCFNCCHHCSITKSCYLDAILQKYVCLNQRRFGLLVFNHFNDWTCSQALFFYLFVRPLLAGWCRHPQLEGEVLCRTLHTPPRPSHRGGSAALPDALWWEHSGSWTTRTNMAAGTTSWGDLLISTVSDRTSSDPVSFFVIKYLWVDSVELQHQLVDQLRVHPLIWAQKVGVHLQTFMVSVKIWSKMSKRKWLRLCTF